MVVLHSDTVIYSYRKEYWECATVYVEYRLYFYKQWNYTGVPWVNRNSISTFQKRFHRFKCIEYYEVSLEEERWSALKSKSFIV